LADKCGGFRIYLCGVLCSTVGTCYWVYFFLIVSFLILIIFVFVGVDFLTLLERKVLGYVHILRGPNRVGFIGVLQPFSDAIRLFSREQYFPLVSNYFLLFFSYFGVFHYLFGF
jgi:NADH-ubiquinone oxidoreductase chain 1